MQRVKMGKKKNDQADAKWRHSTEAVEKGKITYNCKFLGSTPVSQSKGSELIKEAIKKLQFANDIKKSEEGLKASKLKKVELCISVNNLVVTDIKSKSTLYSFPLQRISYCADDKSSKRLFGFIAREKESPQHHCYVLESEKNAEELTLAVGQAFDIAYRKFKASQAAGDKKVDEMQKRVASTEKENELLKKRLDELERAQKGADTPPAPRAAMPVAATSENLIQGENGFTPAPSNSVQPTFDPFSESGTIDFNLNSGPANSGPIEISQASNPFAAIAQEKPESNQGDLLHMFGTSNSPATPQQDDIFDPLAQVNGLSSTQENIPQQMPKSSSLEEAPSPQNEMPAAPVMPASVSRPKSTGLSGGLLPPPPTKQSIKERNKSSISQGEQANIPSLVPEVGGDSNQGVKELQDGVENNLVLF